MAYEVESGLQRVSNKCTAPNYGRVALKPGPLWATFAPILCFVTKCSFGACTYDSYIYPVYLRQVHAPMLFEYAIGQPHFNKCTCPRPPYTQCNMHVYT